jgi:hypothetical protein
MNKFIKRHMIVAVLIVLFMGTVFACIGTFYICDSMNLTQGHFNNANRFERTILISLVIAITLNSPLLFIWYRKIKLKLKNKRRVMNSHWITSNRNG